MKITIAQLNYTVGDLAGNAAKIMQVIAQHRDSTDLLVFSELAVTGYYPYDLIDRPSFVAAQDAEVERIGRATAGSRAAVVVGHICHNSGPGKPYHNGMSFFVDGKCRMQYHKRLLPTYNIFHERRHFEPGNSSGVVSFKGHRIGFLICEDAWNDDGHDYPDNPVEELVGNNVRLLISINASPSNLGKLGQRRKLVKKLCKRHAVSFLYVNQVGATDEIVFDGHSFAVDWNGRLAMQAPGFAEATPTIEYSDRHFDFVNAAPTQDIDDDGAEFMYRQAVCGLQDYARKCGFNQVVVGSSGGIDSALTLALAADALGAGNVAAITMPSSISSTGSVTDSAKLCENLGVKLHHAPIAELVAGDVSGFERDFGVKPADLTVQNIQARIRGRMLMAFSNQFGNLVLSTGNKSEMSTGYATLYGDMNGGLNLLGDLYKTDVYAVARYYNHLHGRELIPEAILTKAPSAELLPGQKDSDSLPEYPVLDAILKLYLEGEFLPQRDIDACKRIISGMPDEEIARVHAMVDHSEFKRRQAPPIIRIHARAFEKP
ncbi:MAG: NAD+ synthase [Betaproteobacteria bacterium]|nr:NAD+ synthase [Betaproteobacteria bacterium]